MEEGFSLFSVLMRLVIRINGFMFAEFLNACVDQCCMGPGQASSWLHDKDRV